jgi:type I restriction enzyme S subunit
VRAASTVLFGALQRIGTPQKTLAELTETPQYGFTASSSIEPIGPKFVRITDIQDGAINWESVPYCECLESDKYLLKPNDILFARTGATTGKTYLVKETPFAIFASYLIRIRPKSEISPAYIYSFFQSDLYWSQIAVEKEGSAQPNVNGKKLSTVEMPIVDSTLQSAIATFLQVVRDRQDGSKEPLPELPSPLSEQRRIVARIEKLAAKIEEARGLRKKAGEEVEALFASLKIAIFEKQPCWKEARVGDFCEPPQYGYTESATTEPIGPRFLRITDIKNGHVDWDSVPFCNCPDSEKYLLKENDLVFARTGATTGKSFLITKCPEAIFASYLIRLRVKHSVSIEYLYQYFQTPSYWSQITDEKKGTGQPNVNGKKLANIRVPIPPLPEQRHIIAYLDKLQAKVDALRRLQTETGADWMRCCRLCWTGRSRGSCK